MRLIDADKLMPINASIAAVIRGELTHYEKTEIINEHVTKWSDKRNGDPKVVKALDDILKEIASS